MVVVIWKKAAKASSIMLPHSLGRVLHSGALSFTSMVMASGFIRGREPSYIVPVLSSLFGGAAPGDGRQRDELPAQMAPPVFTHFTGGKLHPFPFLCPKPNPQRTAIQMQDNTKTTAGTLSSKAAETRREYYKQYYAAHRLEYKRRALKYWERKSNGNNSNTNFSDQEHTPALLEADKDRAAL